MVLAVDDRNQGQHEVFSYAEAEALLARLHAADSSVQAGAFRGRLKHLKRLGVPLGSSPGSGKKPLYSAEQLYQWSFCLELEEFGIDPSVIADLVNRFWSNYIYSAYKLALKKAPKMTFFTFRPQMLSMNWSEGDGIAFLGRSVEDDLSILFENMKERPPHRICLFDITRAVLAVDKASTRSEGPKL